MIRLQDLTPDVYYHNSRDFQLVGRLFDLVLNSVKTEADILFNLPLSTDSPDQLLNLMATTFGLRLDGTKYTSAQLRAVCSIAPKLMRFKGSLQAVKYLITALLRADGSTEKYRIEEEINPETGKFTGNLLIKLPMKTKHRAILDEILPYILPAGITYNLQQAIIKEQDNSITYNIGSDVSYNWAKSVHTQVQPALVLPADNLAELNFFKTSDSLHEIKPGMAIGSNLNGDIEDYIRSESIDET